MKIRIIGCSGSGKTYLAKRLSKKYNIPNFDLDDIQWDNSQNSYGVKMPIEKRGQMLNDILQQDVYKRQRVKAFISIGLFHSFFRRGTLPAEHLVAEPYSFFN